MDARQQYNAQPYDDGSYNERYNDERRNNDEGRFSGENQRYTAQDNSRFNNDDYAEPQQEKRWKGPFAKIEFTSDGKFIKETPEVAHARQQHLAALEHARKNNPSSGVGYEGVVYGQDGPEQHRQQERNQYNVNENNRGFEDDGQYRGEGSAQYRAEPFRNWQGQGNQVAGRQQGYY
jgi:hypothetical protein